MRIRQIVFAANDLTTTLDTLGSVLNGPVVFRDPGVAEFGLENGLLVSGGDFIEVVSPLAGQADTAAGRHIARRGDSFYMLIFQCADAQPVIARLSENGLRPVWQYDKDALVATHFHPRDFGPAIVSIDSMPPSDSGTDWQDANADWFWARWPNADSPKAEDTATGSVAGLTLYAPDADRLAHDWADYLAVGLRGNRLQFDGAFIEFIEQGGCDPYIGGVTLRGGKDAPQAVLARARAAGLAVSENGFDYCGVTWRFNA